MEGTQEEKDIKGEKVINWPVSIMAVPIFCKYQAMDRNRHGPIL